MDEKLLLEAIRGMLREEISGEINGLREELNGKIDSLRADMEVHNRETRVIVENGYKRIENLLREDYGRVADAAAKGAAVAESHQELKSTVKDHDQALQNHNQRIAVLEEKAV